MDLNEFRIEKGNPEIEQLGTISLGTRIGFFIFFGIIGIIVCFPAFGILGYLFHISMSLDGLLISSILGGLVAASGIDYYMKYDEGKTNDFNLERECYQINVNVSKCFSVIIDSTRMLPQNLIECNSALTQAEKEFHENAYDPFWDAVEKAASALSSLYDNIRQLNSNLRKYNELLIDRQHNYPPLVIDPSTLPDPMPELNRLARVMRLGQTNYEFTMIWEQRKTRAAIIQGFKNLGDAIDNLSSVVERSISELSATVERSAAALGASISAGFEELRNEQSGSRKVIGQFAEEQSRFMRTQNHNLDLIRRKIGAY